MNGDSHHDDLRIHTSVKKGDWGYGDRAGRLEEIILM
jgi:hypothetical protein